MIEVNIFGLWHQGLVMAGVLAQNDYLVSCITKNSEEKKELEQLILPVYEPGLIELIGNGIKVGRLKFVDKEDFVLNQNAVIILGHDTDINKDHESDLTSFNLDLDFVMLQIDKSSKILITTQIEMGTYNSIISKYVSNLSNVSEVISIMPENLRLGKAIERFKNPPLPVIGCSESNKEFWKNFFKFTIQDFHFCTQTEAEVLKHTLNSYLALNIAFGNEIYRLADKVGAQGTKIINLLELEPRVGKLSPKKPGMPFFGGTLARDLVSLQKISIEKQIQNPLVSNILDSNLAHQEFVLRKILEYKPFSIPSELRICILGLTYTAETSTLRSSPGLWLNSELRSRSFNVSAFDPRVTKVHKDIDIITNFSDFRIQKFDCFILVSPWPSLKSEISEFVSNEFFVDIEGYLLKNEVVLPINYNHIF
jgi:UDPglucose 6-dehydrogenase